MSENERRGGKINRFASSFTTISLFVMIALLSLAVLGLASQLENIAPAEFKLLINILKNRFFN